MNTTVRGNSYYLKVNIYKNEGNGEVPFNLNDVDQVQVNIYQELTGKRLCHSTERISNTVNEMIIDVSGLPCGNKYVIEVVGLKNSRAFRGAEIGHIGVTEYNEDSDPIFDDEVNITIDFVNNYLVVEKQQKHEANLVEITYDNLVSLRNNSGLIKGMNYRLIDYECTTTQENTDAAGNIFDIIVTATDVNTLNENAKAIKHNGDSYFSKNNLNAWELKYSLDNDATRFAWADAEDGKGVIYYMKDEFNNECPYDFKNIKFLRSVSNVNGNYEIDEREGNDEYIYTFAANKYNVDEDEWSELFDGSLESPYYHKSDEPSSTYHNNVIRPLIKEYVDDLSSKSGIQYLNNIVFIGYIEEIVNYEDENTYYYAYCSFGNTFGMNCSDMSFNYSCDCNIFGNRCSNNMMYNHFSDNVIGNQCQGNNFSSGFYQNILCNGFDDNTCGGSIYCCYFGNGFTHNTIGNACVNNNFLNYCSRNVLGNSCSNNSFANNCLGNNLLNDCSYNSFGNNCQNINFNYRYTRNVNVEQNNQNITLNCTQSTTASKYIRNVTIAAGTNISASNKSISVAPMTEGRLTVQKEASSTQNV